MPVPEILKAAGKSDLHLPLFKADSWAFAFAIAVPGTFIEYLLLFISK
jgi:hypothetical protein